MSENLLGSRSLRVAFQLLVLPLIAASSAFAADVSYLSVDASGVTTTHALPVRIELAAGHEPMGTIDFVESYGGPSFNISASAFSRKETLVAVHAEMYTDGRAGLDYSHLAEATLGGEIFHARFHCADLREESAEDIAANGFLGFLVERGYDLDTAMLMSQFFKTNEEGTAELVLSYMQRSEDCAPADEPDFDARMTRGAEMVFTRLSFGTE